MFRSLLAKRKQFVPDNPFFFTKLGRLPASWENKVYVYTNTL